MAFSVTVFLLFSLLFVNNSLSVSSQQNQDIHDLVSMVQSLQQQVTAMQNTLNNQGKVCSTVRMNPRDCMDVLQSGKNDSGQYVVYPSSLQGLALSVYCDMNDTDGGWLLIQRRQDGSVNFFRNWHDYEHGFGNLTGEHWLGNKNIHAITASGQYELRVTLEDYQGNKKIASYRSFSIGDSDVKYQLTVDGFSGDAGDSLKFDHNGHAFSTADADNDGATSVNCAQKHAGGYWYSNCFKSNINGKWGVKSEQGIIWGSFKNWDMYALKKTEMKIRPVQP